MAGRRFAPLDLSVPFWPLFFVVDLVLQPMMLRAIKRRVEWAAQQRAGTSSSPSDGGANLSGDAMPDEHAKRPTPPVA